METSIDTRAADALPDGATSAEATQTACAIFCGSVICIELIETGFGWLLCMAECYNFFCFNE
jgi:hypothetical protein